MARDMSSITTPTQPVEHVAGSTTRAKSVAHALITHLAAALLILSAILVAFPFIWMIHTSLMPEDEVLQFPPVWIPSHLTLQHYMDALTLQPCGRYIFNSFFVAVATTAGQLLMASMGAYAFARLRFPGRDKLFLQAHALIHHFYIVTATQTRDCLVYDITGAQLLYEKGDDIYISHITLDLDRGIYHENFNIEKRDRHLSERGGDVAQEQHLDREQWFVLKAQRPGISARGLARQYGLEELRDYIDRSRREIDERCPELGTVTATRRPSLISA